jgi:hypothetical protein
LPAEKHHAASRVPHTAVAIHARQVDLLTPSTLPILVRSNWIPAREKPDFLIVIVRRPLLDTIKGAASQFLFVRASTSSNKHPFSRFTSPSHRVWHSLLHHKGVSNREACPVPFLSISPSLHLSRSTTTPGTDNHGADSHSHAVPSPGRHNHSLQWAKSLTLPLVSRQ